MGKLKDVLSVKRGKYRACYGGIDLGELASPPEIRADYDSGKISVFSSGNNSRVLEGGKELHAKINLRTKSIVAAFGLLGEIPETPHSLVLKNSDQKNETALEFPMAKLLPVWDFEPSFSGDHLISLNFYAESDANSKLFYFSGT